MPLYGYLEGYNDETKALQEQQAQRDLSQVRNVETAKSLQQLNQSIQTQGVLAQIFQGGQDTNDPARLSMAARAISPINPQLGLQYATRASEIQHRQGLDQKEQLAEAKKKEGDLASTLSSASDQQTYESALDEYVAKGGKPLGWMTGDFATDKPFIRQQQNASLSTLQQIERAQKDTDLQLRMSDLVLQKNRLEETQAARQQRMQMLQEAAQQKAAAAAQKREGLNAVRAIPKKEERNQAEDVLAGVLGDGYDEMDYNSRKAAATRAASIAKQQQLSDEGEGVDFESHLQDAYQGMIERGELKMPKKGSFLGFGGEKASFKPNGGQPSQRSQTPGGSEITEAGNDTVAIQPPIVPAIQPKTPKIGSIIKGYRFKGGNPSDQNAWEKIK